MYKLYSGQVLADGSANVEIQQDNASMEWDIYQIALSGPATSSAMTAQVLLNSFLLCNTPAAQADTATGPPDVVLSRSDKLNIMFASGNPGDKVNVGIWFTENPAGTTVI